MRMYKVRWEIDVDAEDPQAAARKALQIQRDPNSTATVFDMNDAAYARNECTRVDIPIEEAQHITAPLKHYVFYIAWVQDSPGAGGEDTNINTQDDLIPQFQAGNGFVSAYFFTAPDDDAAYAIGESHAFREGYMATDTVSTCMEVDNE